MDFWTPPRFLKSLCAFSLPEHQKKPHVRNFLPALLGPEMAARILWAPEIFWFLLEKASMPIKFLVFFWGGGILGWGGGGGSANFLFLWAWTFSCLSTMPA